MTAFLIVLMTLGFMVVMYAIQGWVLSIMWGWFIVPLFHLPPLSILQAIGLTLVVVLLTGSASKTAQTSEERVTNIATGVIGPFIALLVGWIIHSMM
jgi:hypothetical protein